MAKRYLAIVILFFGVSALLCSFVPLSNVLFVLPVLCVLLAVGCLIPNRYRITIVSCIAASIVAVLYCYFSFEPLVRLENRLLADSNQTIVGTIVDVGSNSAGTLTEYTVSLDEVGADKVSWFERADVAFYCDESVARFEVGQKIEGRLQFFDSPVEFGAGREERLILNAYYDAREPLSIVGKNEFQATYRQIKESVISQLRFGEDETIGLLKSICFGDKSELDSEIYISLKRVGLSHVMAVSGLHLSFTLFLVYFFLILFRVNYRIRYLIGIPISIAFTALVGFPLSCVRACIMLVLFSLAMALDLFPDSLTALAVSAFIILVFNPFSVRDIGFLLSVAATAGIIILNPYVENFLFPKKIGKNHRIISAYRKITGAVSCSVSASIFTAPITILAFESFSLIAPFANLILIFPIQLMFILGIIMILLGWIPFVGPLLGWLCDLLNAIVCFFAQLMGKFPFSSVSSFNYAGLFLLILFFAVLGVSVYIFKKYNRRAFFVLFGAFLCFSSVFGVLYGYSHSSDAVQIAFVDVGQGDCTVISKGSRAVVIDCGGSSDKRYNINRYLMENNLYQVELLAFTHQHNDHINGLNNLLKNVYVNDIIYPKLTFDSDLLQALMVKQGAEIITESRSVTVLDDVLLDIIAEPAMDDSGSGLNERCVCYRITYGDFSLLITGDLHGDAELKWLNDQSGCTVLRVPHHGSDSSTMYSFLKRISPEVAIISVGENPYGLPDDSVLKRLESICDSTLLTLNEGTICYQTDGTILERIK